MKLDDTVKADICSTGKVCLTADEIYMRCIWAHNPLDMNHPLISFHHRHLTAPMHNDTVRKSVDKCKEQKDLFKTQTIQVS